MGFTHLSKFPVSSIRLEGVSREVRSDSRPAGPARHRLGPREPVAHEGQAAHLVEHRRVLLRVLWPWWPRPRHRYPLLPRAHAQR